MNDKSQIVVGIVKVIEHFADGADARNHVRILVLTLYGHDVRLYDRISLQLVCDIGKAIGKIHREFEVVVADNHPFDVRVLGA